jgi:hypothetical protein
MKIKLCLAMNTQSSLKTRFAKEVLKNLNSVIVTLSTQLFGMSNQEQLKE